MTAEEISTSKFLLTTHHATLSTNQPPRSQDSDLSSRDEFSRPRDWHEKLPLLPYSKPTWKRGQDAGTAIRISYPDEPSVYNPIVRYAHGNAVRDKRSFFTAFEQYAAQDAAVLDATSQEQTRPPRASTAPPKAKKPTIKLKQRRDSLQDASPSLPPAPVVKPPALVSPAPTEPPKAPPPAATPSTEAPRSQRAASTPVPRGLEIDGNAALDPHKADDELQGVVRTYLWKGRRYEVTGDEPEEWLRDVRVSAPSAGAASARASLVGERTETPEGAEGRRTRNSLRGGERGDEGRRRSSRRE